MSIIVITTITSKPAKPTGGQVDGTVRRHVIRKANLVRLVNVEHVDLIVPAPGVQHSGLGVRGDEAGAVFLQQTHHGGGPRAAVEPDGQGSVGRVLASLEEPEESEQK